MMVKTGRIVRPDNSGLRFPRAGKLKIGYKKQTANGGEIPCSVDYFIPTGVYAAFFTKAYGEKPNTIQVLFPSNDPSECCNERYEYRDDAGKLLASGDGIDFDVWNGEAYIPMDTIKYPNLMQSLTKKYPTRKTEAGKENWEIVLTARFIVPMVQGIAGYWEFSTKGAASTIQQVRNTFDAMNEITKGNIQNVLFDLHVEFAKTQKPGDKSRYPVVTLIPNETRENVERVQAAMPRKLAQIGTGDE